MSWMQNLTQAEQAIVMLNFEFSAKKILIGAALLFSLYYVFHKHPNQSETPFFMVSMGRMFLYLISQAFLWTSPLTIFYLYPQASFDVLIAPMLTVYTIGFFVVGAIVLLNLILFFPLMLLGIGGYKPAADHANKMLNANQSRIKMPFTDDKITIRPLWGKQKN